MKGNPPTIRFEDSTTTRLDNHGLQKPEILFENVLKFDLYGYANYTQPDD